MWSLGKTRSKTNMPRHTLAEIGAGAGVSQISI